MSVIDDELVSQFLAFTGSADPSSAVSYLEMSGGDIQTAVSLYMEHQGGGGGGGGGFSNGDMAGGNFDGIRAPDETRTMRLMDDNMMQHDPSFQLMSAMMEEQFAQSAFGSRNVMQDVRAAVNAAAANQNPYAGEEKESGAMDTDDDDDDDEVQIIQPPRLEDMFAPPDHLLHKAGGFQGARTVAKDSKRWLLVNIQRDNEFACHALNRDVWRDELVENLIREGFIFWQQRDITPEGQTYVERYKVADYPHVGIIDPRTARLVWRKEGWTQEKPLTAELFAEYAMDFCSRNSFDRPPQVPRPGAASLPAKRPMLSEDEQLQAAMRASLRDAGADDDSDSVVYVDDSDDEDKEDEQMDSKPVAKEEEKSILNELLSMPVGDEPAGGARIQFRTPDGKRVIRKFAGSDRVKVIYAFIAQTNEEARGGKEFVVMAGFPPEDLASKMESETIDACKLAGQAVTVRWKS